MGKVSDVSTLIDDLEWRGAIAQTTDREQLVARLIEGPIALYCGFDPTAPSLHLGHLVPLLMLRRFQQAGHRPIAVVGGATGLIGDPSGRSSERSLNTGDTVAEWVQRLRTQIEHFVDFDSGEANEGALVSNLDWTKDLSTIDFLRDIGKHFSVNVMLSKDSVKSRLEDQGISFTEFSYMVLQSWDYLNLYREYGCRLQIGGSDQWGNITAGLDLIRRVEGSDAEQAFALTVPLVTKSDGAKFGKTEKGAIWLDPSMTSPYEFYQFWLNTDDRDIENFFKLFSLRPRDEIESILSEQAEAPHSRVAQRSLAEEMTDLVHGQAERESAVNAAKALFGGGDIAQVDERTLEAVLSTAGVVELDAADVRDDGMSVVDLLVDSGLVDSKGAARRAIKEGGAYLNNERITDQEQIATTDQLLHGRWWLLRRGKKNFAGVEVKRS